MERKVWKVTLQGDDAEKDSYPLGVPCEILSENTFAIYLSRTEPELQAALQSFKEAGLISIYIEEFKNENWVQLCEEIWEPLHIKELELIPVLSGKNRIRQKNQILIVPGTGFGTGHHQSTRLALALLQDPRLASSLPKTLLDIGTGNGILALGGVEVFGCTAVAIDNDPLAIINAKENVDLNGVPEKITLLEGTISTIKDTFDLITSNIYAEVLCELEPEFYRSAKIGGYIILAGITADKASMVKEKLGERWRLVREMGEDDWVGMLWGK